MFVLITKFNQYSDGSLFCEHIKTKQTIWLEQREIDSNYKLCEYETEQAANNAKDIINKADNSIPEIKVVEFTEKFNEKSHFNQCRFKWITGGFTEDIKYICDCKEHPRRDESNKDYPSPVIIPDECKDCSLFKTKYIQYPVEINGIIDNFSKRIKSPYHTRGCGNLVKIRVCEDNKTYLGICLGDGVIGNHISHSSETGMLEISPDTNPAIFVPALKKIVYGCQSWWGEIKSEEDLKDISDDDINNIWYVQLLKGMTKE